MFEDMLQQQALYWFGEQLTLRDQFSMAALNGLLSSMSQNWNDTITATAEGVYRYADAMMKARGDK